MRSARSILGVTCVCISLACADSPTAVCTDELGVNLTPAATTLLVGQSLTPQASLSTCGGRVRPTAVLTLSVPVGASVVISSDGRSVVAVAPGVADVGVDDAQFGRLGAVRVTVVAAP
jgi:hypothetical protein